MLCQEGRAISIEALIQCIADMNEILFLMDEDRNVIGASSMTYSELGYPESTGCGVLADCITPVYLDALFSRGETDALRSKGVTMQLKDAFGTNIDVEARISWLSAGDQRIMMVLCRNIASFLDQVNRLTQKEDLYRTIFHESPLGFIHINSDGIVADCNQEFLNIFGYFSGQVVGVCVAFDSHHDLEERFCAAAMDAIMGNGSSYEDRFEVDSGLGPRNGWVRVAFSPIMSDNFSFLGAVGIVEDITDEKEAERKIEYIGNHDALTGLFNRHACETDMMEIDTDENIPIGIIYADLNHLKLANDAFGHEEGDALLKNCASILSDGSSANDKCYRLGGDEFVIIMKNTTPELVKERERKMLDACANWTGGGIVRPSMSLGSSVKRTSNVRVADVLKEAEDLMYAAKLRNGPIARKNLMLALENRLSKLRDGAVGRRSARMEKWAELAADIFEVREDADIEKLRTLFRYHDIGMLGFDDELNHICHIPIDKPDLQHTVVGYRIARTVSEISNVADLILFHHERWDGRGFPNQMKGRDIPFLARLVSIFDMLEGAVCLDGKSFDEALDDVAGAAGTLFDPEMTMKVVTAVRQSRPKFADDTEAVR